MSAVVKMTARDLIRRTLKLIGILAEGEYPSDEGANDALITLNEIVDKWNTETLMIFGAKYNTINLNGSPFYEINLDIQTGIRDIYFLHDNMSTKIDLISESDYADLYTKNMKGNPDRAFLNLIGDPSNSLDLKRNKSNLFIYPISDVGQVVYTTPFQFYEFKSLDDIIDLPSGYLSALKYNLAVLLSEEYGKQVSQNLLELAVGAKASIKANNSTVKRRQMKSSFDIGNGCSFNIYSGE